MCDLVYTQGRMLRKLQVKKTDSQLRIPIQNFQIASDTSGLPYWKFEETDYSPYSHTKNLKN